MRLVGMNPVVVHGGGPQITDLMRRLGKEPEFVDGRRVTDAETVDIVRMALVGKVNREIVASVNRHGSYAVGLSGEDAGLIRVDQRDPALGFVGDVRAIDPTIVLRLLREELIPVIATVGVDDDGQAYNVNADTVAGAIAEALDAEKLVYLTDVAGVYGDWPDEASLISRIDVAGLEQLDRRRQGLRGHDPEARVVRRRRCATACGARTSSTAGCRTRCCSSSSPGKVSERWCTHDASRRARSSRSFDELAALDAEHVMQTYGRLPVAFVRGEGTLLCDSEGKRYLDFLAGLAVTSLGHAHPEVADAIADQARTLLHVSNLYYNDVQPQRRRAARRAARRRRPRVLRQLGRRGQRVRDQARPPLRPAHGGPERYHVISAYGSFHGRTLTTLAATGQPQKQETFQPLPDGLPPGRVRRPRRARGRDRRPRRGGDARSRCRARAA